MAVFTNLSDHECSQIAAAYQLGSLTSVIGIADGDTETTYLFRSSRGEFIVTLFETGADPLDLERAFRTMETVSALGIPCPTPFRTAAGAATIIVSGKLVAVVSFVPGSLAHLVTEEKCRSLGAATAQIHRALQPALRVSIDAMPHGPVHGALSRDNVFFVGDSVSGIINFRRHHDELLITELAGMLIEWTMLEDGGIDQGLAAALVGGYHSVRPLSAAERCVLPSILMGASASHFAVLGQLDAVTEKSLLTFRHAQSFANSFMP